MSYEGRGFSRKNRASSTYTCEACDKRTRETGYGESDLRLCKRCYVESGMENEHSDAVGTNKEHISPVYEEGFICPACVEDKVLASEGSDQEENNVLIDTLWFL